MLNILSSAIGFLTNPEKLRNTFRTVKKSKITANTIHKYLSYFEDSFLIESAQRYDIKGKAYIGTPKKYYFSDIGLRNARIKFRQLEQTHSMENVIYNELRMRGYSVDVGVVPVTEKETNGKIARKQLEWTLSATWVRPDIIFTPRAFCLMRQSGRGRSSRFERSMILKKTLSPRMLSRRITTNMVS